MKLKKSTTSRILIIIVLAIFIGCVYHDTREGGSRPDLSLSLPGTVWSYSSKQKIGWTVSGVADGTRLVVYLKHTATGEKGCLFRVPIQNGSGDIHYVVNAIRDKKNQTTRLANGTYMLSAALYTPQTDSEDAGRAEDRIVEKNMGEITITDSDVH